MGYLDKDGLSRAFTKLKTLIDQKANVGHTHTKAQVGLGNVDNTADANKSVKYAASAGSANTAATATKATSADNATHASTSDMAIEVADYNNTKQGIKIGYAGNGFTSADFQYALGMNDERKIKNVSRAEYRTWLGLGSAAYTSSGSYAASRHAHSKSQITDFPTSMPASDVYSWAKQSSKPSYSASEVGAVPTSRTVNGKELSANITLSAGDVGAAASSHSHNYAGSSSAGGNANWANGSTYANYSYNDKPITTAGTGDAYTARVSGLTLVSGASFVMVPHTASTTVAPTLNVNSLGAKNIRMRLSSNTSSTIQLIKSDFLVANKPVKVVYDGTYWVLDDFVQPDASYLYGTLISRGTSAPSNSTGGFIYIQTT